MKKIIPLFIFGIFFSFSFVSAQTLKVISAPAFKLVYDTLNMSETVIIDARDSLKFSVGHLQNAVNIDAFSENAQDLLSGYLDKKTIIVYCTMNKRSEKVIEILRNINYSGLIIDIEDGITGLETNGFITTPPASIKVENTHTVNKKTETHGQPIIQVFGNFDYNATPNTLKQYGFWFGRAHFGYQYQFNEQFKGKIIIDAGRPTSVGTIIVSDTSGYHLNTTNSSKEGSYYTMTLKFASLEWKPADIFKIQAGGILQNHYITQEKFWGYRYLAETFQDRYYKIPSADLGFIAFVKPNDRIGFDFALTNGEGFRFDQDAYGDVKIASGIDLYPAKNLQTRIYYDYTKSKNPLKPAEQQLFSAFAGYKFKNKFRVGTEYNYRKNHLNIAHQNLYGYSVYGSCSISSKFEYFARFDRLMSNIKTIQTTAWNFMAIITGFHYTPVQNVNLSLNYQGLIPENKGNLIQHHILMCFEYKL